MVTNQQGNPHLGQALTFAPQQRGGSASFAGDLGCETIILALTPPDAWIRQLYPTRLSHGLAVPVGIVATGLRIHPQAVSEVTKVTRQEMELGVFK